MFTHTILFASYNFAEMPLIYELRNILPQPTQGDKDVQNSLKLFFI